MTKTPVPIFPSAPGFLSRDEEAASSAGIAPVKGRPLVLMVGDGADLDGYAKRLLEAGGYQVEAVANGREALEAATRGDPPELLLTDTMTADLDGFGLLAVLDEEARLKGIPVILLSAGTGEEARREALAAGADDYLVRPFGPRELRARVDGAMRLGRERRAAAARERELQAQIAAEHSRADLRQTEEQLEFALDAARLGSWQFDIAAGTFSSSAQSRTVFGLGPDEPFERYEDVVALVHPDDRALRQAAIDRAIATGEDLELEYRIQRQDGGIGWILVRGRAAFEDGRAVRLAGVSLDITQRKTAEARQRLLLDELNHRVKNTLATVQSIAFQTLGEDSVFRDAFIARLLALSGAHELLTEAAWQGASLADVVTRTLGLVVPGDPAGRLDIQGPGVKLGPNAAVTLNMAFFELATNAMKYGALSGPDGRLEVHWRLEAGGEAILVDWREMDGPPVAVPSRRGFGSRLIERGLNRELGGVAQLSFLPEGFWCHIRLPISAKLRLAA